jgi:YjbE family integral membrane protein
MLELLGALGGIVLVDLALSGDNALVIGAAAAALPAHQRRRAIALGGAGAIALRIVFAIAATLLLRLPLLQAAGGVVLLVIAVRLLVDRGEHPKGTAGSRPPVGDPATGGLGSVDAPGQARQGFAAALTTILVADVTMSLDNVLAIGALAAGNLPLLAGGLILSMGLLLVGSAVVAVLIGRLPWLLDVAALVLGWTASTMLLEDHRLGVVFERVPWAGVAVPAACIGFVLVADLWLRRAVARQRAEHGAREKLAGGQVARPNAQP